MPTGPMGVHPDEPHGDSLSGLLNRLRAGVLGANDGIVSVAGIVMGFAGATSHRQTILFAGIAGLVAGALSMAAGEYVSVSSQRDTERALIRKERRELAEEPEEELAELAELYRRKGLSPDLAEQVAHELTGKDALRAHLDIELGIDPDELSSPVAGRAGLDGRFHGRRAAAPADDAALPARCPDRGHDRGGGGRPGPHRPVQRAHRRRAARAGHRCATWWAVCSRWG